MSFRNESEHLRHKNKLLEEQLAEAQRKFDEERRDVWKRRWSSVKATATAAISIALGGGLVVLMVAGANYGYRWYQQWDSAQAEARVEAHQRMLGDLREHVPDGVNPETWRWCVDHCARYGHHDESGHAFSEGVVIDTFLDYRSDPPAELMTISGPWLDASRHQRMTHFVTEETLDPPATHFETGDVIRVTFHSSKHGTDYVFRHIHPE
jgi:hypothetical protein